MLIVMGFRTRSRPNFGVGYEFVHVILAIFYLNCTYVYNMDTMPMGPCLSKEHLVAYLIYTRPEVVEVRQALGSYKPH